MLNKTQKWSPHKHEEINCMALTHALVVVIEGWAECCHLRVSVSVSTVRGTFNIKLQTDVEPFCMMAPRHRITVSPTIVRVLFSGDPETATIVTGNYSGQHIQGIFPLSRFTYSDTASQDKAGHQLTKLTQGFLCMFIWKRNIWPITMRPFMDHMTLLPQKMISLSTTAGMLSNGGEDHKNQ